MADNAIRIPVIVEVTEARAALTALRTTATQETAATARTVEANLGSVEATSKRVVTSTTAAATAATTAVKTAGAAAAQATDGLKAGLQGVAPAVSALSGSFAAMGHQLPAGIGAITTSLSTLLTTGLGPLGLAMAGITAAVGLFAAAVEDKVEPAAAAAADRIATLREEIGKLEMQLGASRSGVPLGVYEPRQRIEALSREAAAITARDAEIRAQLNAARAAAGDSSLSSEERGSARSEIANLTAMRAAGDARIHVIQREVDELNRKLGVLRAIEAQELKPTPAPTYDTKPRTTDDLARFRAQLDYVRRSVEMERRAARAELPRTDLMSAIGTMPTWQAPDTESVAYRPMTMPTDTSSFAPPGQTLPTHDELVRQELIDRNADRPDQTYTATLNRSLSQSVEGAMIGGISSALSDPGNWQGALESFASAIQSAVSTRIAAGLVDALMGNTQTNTYGAGGIIGSLISAWLSPSSPSTTGTEGVGTGDPMAPDVSGDGPGKMAAQPIVVVNTYDESFADATVARASAAGFRVGLAKASGGGVSRGAIPSRGGR